MSMAGPIKIYDGCRLEFNQVSAQSLTVPVCSSNLPAL